MNKEAQAQKLVELGRYIEARLNEEGVKDDFYSDPQPMEMHVDDKLFACIARLSECRVESTYQHAALHGSVDVGGIRFVCCHNLL